jgi:hypothetical protein
MSPRSNPCVPPTRFPTNMGTSGNFMKFVE